MDEIRHRPTLSWTALHYIAMTAMLMDHIGIVLPFPGSTWLRCIGRISFPLFGFLIVEGFFRTHHLGRYMLRLFLLALISEAPFDLMVYSRPWEWQTQNTVWTYLIALGTMWILENFRLRVSRPFFLLAAAIGSGWALASILHTDYGFPGVLMVLCFYLFAGSSQSSHRMQTISFVGIEIFLMGGLEFSGGYLSVHEQIFALLALIPLKLYNRRRDISGISTRVFFYSFYPVHMLFLYTLSRFIY